MGFTVKRVLRRVLRRGSEKGVSRRCLERPFVEYAPLGVPPTYAALRGGSLSVPGGLRGRGPFRPDPEALGQILLPCGRGRHDWAWVLHRWGPPPTSSLAQNSLSIASSDCWRATPAPTTPTCPDLPYVGRGRQWGRGESRLAPALQTPGLPNPPLSDFHISAPIPFSWGECFQHRMCCRVSSVGLCFHKPQKKIHLGGGLSNRWGFLGLRDLLHRKLVQLEVYLSQLVPATGELGLGYDLGLLVSLFCQAFRLAQQTVSLISYRKRLELRFLYLFQGGIQSLFYRLFGRRLDLLSQSRFWIGGFHGGEFPTSRLGFFAREARKAMRKIVKPTRIPACALRSSVSP